MPTEVAGFVSDFELPREERIVKKHSNKKYNDCTAEGFFINKDMLKLSYFQGYQKGRIKGALVGQMALHSAAYLVAGEKGVIVSLSATFASAILNRKARNASVFEFSKYAQHHMNAYYVSSYVDEPRRFFDALYDETAKDQGMTAPIGMGFQQGMKSSLWQSFTNPVAHGLIAAGCVLEVINQVSRPFRKMAMLILKSFSENQRESLEDLLTKESKTNYPIYNTTRHLCLKAGAISPQMCAERDDIRGKSLLP